MEAQQGGGIEPRLAQIRPLPLTQEVGQGQGGLLGVVGGKDGGAVEAPGPGKGAPLDAHGEENGIQRRDHRHILREKAHGHRYQGVHRRAQPPHIHMEQVRQQYRGHGAREIDHQAKQVQQGAAALSVEGVHDHLQQVHGLGAGQHAASGQDGVAAKKAAHGGKGQVPVKVRPGTVFLMHDRILPFPRPCRLSSIARVFLFARGKTDDFPGASVFT